MKKKILFGALAILNCLMHSCIDYSNDCFDFKPLDEGIQIDKMEQIKNYVLTTNSSRVKTRADIIFSPLIINGDTTLLLANYDTGWDIFSYDCRTPMVLMSGDTGNIDIEKLDNTGILYALIDELSVGVARIKIENIDSPIDNSWVSVPMRDSINYRGDLSEIEVKSVGPLVSTKWCQSPYWEAYTPKISGKKAKLGCCAIAVGTFLRYTDIAEGLHLEVIPTLAVPNGDSYSFSGLVANRWDSLACTLLDSDVFISNAAMFLAYTAFEINSDFGSDYTTSNLNKCKTYLDGLRAGNRQVFNMTQAPYSASIISQIIDESKLVFVRVKSPNLTENTGHVFIVDGYKCTRKRLMNSITGEPEPSNYTDTLLHAQVGELIGQDETVSTWINSKVNMVWKFAGNTYQRDKLIMYQGVLNN